MIMDDIQLRRGDCLKFIKLLPDASVDCVVTSPPYNTLPRPGACRGSGMHRGNGWLAKVQRIGYPDHRPEEDYQDWLREIVRECLRVSKGIVWINHKVRYRNGEAIHPVRFLPFPIWCEVIWSRYGSMALNCRRFAPSHECLLGFGKPHWWDNRSNVQMSVWRISQKLRNPSDEHHPCAFPVDLAERPIRASCPPGGIVLDPFAGSGTTAIACLRSNRRFLGCEIEPSYYKIAKKRIREAQTSLRQEAVA